MQDEQIIHQGHTPGHVWDALEKRSNQTQRKVTLRCPVCDSSIQHTETPQLRCRSCDAPASLYQHRHLRKRADTRLIYVSVQGHTREVASIKMQCLSCGQTLKADETCDNTCWIQTYLMFQPLDGELYIKRWLNCLHVQRDIPEIPIRLTLPTDAPETDTADNNETQPLNQPLNPPQHQPNAIDEIPEHPNAHTDIAGQIVAYLTDAENHTATAGEMKAAFDCSPEGFNKAIKTLAGRVERIKRGTYQLINP